MLSHHDHWLEESDVKLVPAGGLMVAEAVNRYPTLKNYSVTNPLCARTLAYVSLRTGVYLSRAPLETLDFEPLKRFGPNHLVVLDGLHRLIARRLAQEQSPIDAFIAG